MMTLLPIIKLGERTMRHVYVETLSTLSQKSETVAENGETTATVTLFCDSVDRA